MIHSVGKPQLTHHKVELTATSVPEEWELKILFDWHCACKLGQVSSSDQRTYKEAYLRWQLTLSVQSLPTSAVFSRIRWAGPVLTCFECNLSWTFSGRPVIWKSSSAKGRSHLIRELESPDYGYFNTWIAGPKNIYNRLPPKAWGRYPLFSEKYYYRVKCFTMRDSELSDHREWTCNKIQHNTSSSYIISWSSWIGYTHVQRYKSKYT